MGGKKKNTIFVKGKTGRPRQVLCEKRGQKKKKRDGGKRSQKIGQRGWPQKGPTNPLAEKRKKDTIRVRAPERGEEKTGKKRGQKKRRKKEKKKKKKRNKLAGGGKLGWQQIGMGAWGKKTPNRQGGCYRSCVVYLGKGRKKKKPRERETKKKKKKGKKKLGGGGEKKKTTGRNQRNVTPWFVKPEEKGKGDL